MSNIEYLPGIKVGDKIDLNDPKYADKKKEFPKPESYLPQLKIRLAALADRLNSEHGDFLTSDGQMQMSGSEADYDRVLMSEKVQDWAADEAQTPTEWLARREKNPSNITEIATTLLFDKILGENFIIVRASIYDDYENGADQLIIDKATGAVVCGLDDVIGHLSDDRDDKKPEKIKRKMAAGGAKIKYGATVKAGKLVKQELSHIPLFYFSLSKEELNGLLRSLTAAAGDDEPSPAEKAVYVKLVSSLQEQSDHFMYDARLHPRLQDNLRNFRPSLDRMSAYSHLEKDAYAEKL
ncbi:MAG: hypothetical protein WC456_01255 [Patescibacteria group bacterium]